MNDVSILEAQDNTGSLVKIHFIPIASVVSIPDASDYMISDPIVLATGASWFIMQVSQETPGFTETPNISQTGKVQTIELTGIVSGHNEQITSTLNGMRYQRFLCIAEDFEGRKRLFGTLKNPMRFKWAFTTDVTTKGRKAYQITFYNTSKDSPYFYQSPFVEYPADFGSNADFITLDSYIAALTARVTTLEGEQGSYLQTNGSNAMGAALKLAGNNISKLGNIQDTLDKIVLVANTRAIYDSNGNVIGIFQLRSDGFGITTNGFYAYFKTDNLAANKTLQAGNAGTIAVTQDITDAINALLNGAGPAYDTLKELQDLIISDESSISSLLTAVGLRELLSNKATDFSIINNTLYPTTKAVNDKFLDQSGTKLYAIASGTDTYTATISPAITAYSAGMRFNIYFSNANTGAAASLNLNTLGAKTIVKQGGYALNPGDIKTGTYTLIYNGTNFEIISTTGIGDPEYLIKNPYYFNDFYGLNDWVTLGGKFDFGSHQGDLSVVAFQSSTSAGAKAGCALQNSSFNLSFYTGNGAFTFACKIICSTTNPTSIEDFDVFAGLNDVYANDAVDGIYFLHRRSVYGNFWATVTSSGSVRTTTATTVAVAAGGSYILKAVVNSNATQVDFYIDSGSGFVLVATHTTNIPVSNSQYTSPQISVQKTTTGSYGPTIRADFWLHYLSNFARF